MSYTHNNKENIKPSLDSAILYHLNIFNNEKMIKQNFIQTENTKLHWPKTSESGIQVYKGSKVNVYKIEWAPECQTGAEMSPTMLWNMIIGFRQNTELLQKSNTLCKTCHW